MKDPEVVDSGATTYQMAQIIACVLEFLDNQPERSKREDHHLTLDDFSDNPTKEQLGEEMRKREREILDAVL